VRPNDSALERVKARLTGRTYEAAQARTWLCFTRFLASAPGAAVKVTTTVSSCTSGRVIPDLHSARCFERSVPRPQPWARLSTLDGTAPIARADLPTGDLSGPPTPPTNQLVGLIRPVDPVAKRGKVGLEWALRVKDFLVLG